MRTARIAVSLAILVTASAFGQIDPNGLVSDDCTTGIRASVRNGRIYGTPSDPAAAKVITIDNFLKIKFPTNDSKKFPSKIAPKGLAQGEGVLYRIDNLELRSFGSCHDAIGVEFETFGKFGSPFITALIPSTNCVTDPFKPVVDAARNTYMGISVWGSTWQTDFLKQCGLSGGDTSDQKHGALSVIGYSFWDDRGGEVPPTLVLAPVIAVIEGGTSSGGGGGGGGGTTPGGPTAPPPKNITVNIPASVLEQALFVGNGGDTTVKISTTPINSFNGDVQLEVTSDAGPNDALSVSISPTHFAAPGAGDATVTVHTDAMTFPRVYRVNVTAITSDGQTSTSSFAVSVVCDPPQILGINQPRGLSIGRGSKAQLGVTVLGTGPFAYQWYEGFPGFTGSPVAGGTSANFTSPSLNNSTTYWVRVSNACGTVDSNVALVNVQ